MGNDTVTQTWYVNVHAGHDRQSGGYPKAARTHPADRSCAAGQLIKISDLAAQRHSKVRQLDLESQPGFRGPARSHSSGLAGALCGSASCAQWEPFTHPLPRRSVRAASSGDSGQIC